MQLSHPKEDGTPASFRRGSPWFVINKKIWDVMPHVAVVVEVSHGGLKGGLQSVWVKLKQPQDDAPNQCGKKWERITFGCGDESFFYSQSGQGKQDSRQQIHVDLEWLRNEQTHKNTWFNKSGKDIQHHQIYHFVRMFSLL